jgi:beta-lactamase superfamily II metal-dependent hydrolase
MKVDIFDVDHGACAVITCPDGKRLMIDCGTKTDPPYWWPSIQFYGEEFAGLLLANLDEDHVTDFEKMLELVTVKTVWINDSITAARLKLMKPDGMRSGVTAVHAYLQQPICLNLKLDLPQINVHVFRHTHPTFTDTNNLSFVTFVEYGNFCILFPGDMEEAGWKEFLPNDAFTALLRRVSVAVPSHHGRESGCCADVFNWWRCSPCAFVISDKEKVHETQETTDWYRQHAKGVHKILSTLWDTPETRYVFTTRKDGCVSIEAQLDGSFVLYRQSKAQVLVEPKPVEPAPIFGRGLLDALARTSRD